MFEYCQVFAFDMRKQFAMIRHIALRSVKFGDDERLFNKLQAFSVGAWGALLKTPSIGKHVAKFCINTEISNAVQYFRMVSCIAHGKNLFHAYLMRSDWKGSQVNVKIGLNLFIYDMVRDGDLSTIKNTMKNRFHLESSLVYGGISQVSTVFAFLLRGMMNATLMIPKAMANMLEYIPVVNLVMNISKKVIVMTMKAPAIIMSKFCILSAFGGIGLQVLHMKAPGGTWLGKFIKKFKGTSSHSEMWMQ